MVLNRKNALFAGHDQGAANRACVPSLIETCKLNGVDPQAYFTDVLTKLVNLWPASRIDELMPWAWHPRAPRKPQSSVTPKPDLKTSSRVVKRPLSFLSVAPHHHSRCFHTNRAGDAKRKAKAAPTARPKVPMCRRGADCSVVAMEYAMAVRITAAVQRLQGSVVYAESRLCAIGP
jgi:hypothetical protein